MKISLLGKKKTEGFTGIIDGKVKYEIIHKLGEGGMGAVYQAKMLGVDGFEKIVAIKTLVDRYTNDEKFVTRSIEEAKLVANLIHENIVQIYQLDHTSAGYYFILEYVDGIALHDFIEFHRKARLKMPTNLAVFIAARIARGLAYAHSRKATDGKPLNIVHCDVCTHNIMINTEGVPKIMDFGIAKAVNREDMNGISGKVSFMAPEQAKRNSKLDFSADIYSLGVVLFYMLSGGQLTRKLVGDLTEVIIEIRANNIPWELLPADLDPALLEILHTMLATSPDERYADTSILARDLEYFIYKDGYGPTIVTLANYMREIMPGVFGEQPDETKTDAVANDATENMEKTIVMPTEHWNGSTTEKTTVLPDDYFDKK